MSEMKLADTLQIPIVEAEQLFKEYAQSFPKLNSWLEKQARFGVTNGYIRIGKPHNGIRWFPIISETKKWREEDQPHWREILINEGKVQRDSMNTPIQGTGAAICKEAMVECRELLKRFDGYMLAPIHDELNFEILAEEAEYFMQEACKVMEEVGNKYVKHVKMEVDGTITEVWQK